MAPVLLNTPTPHSLMYTSFLNLLGSYFITGVIFKVNYATFVLVDAHTGNSLFYGQIT